MKRLPRNAADAAALAGFVVLVLAVAGIGSAVTAPAIPGWYSGLVKPAFTPPNWVFAPVWTALYVMMAVAAWLVWRGRRGPRAPALVLFAIQLALNLAWSVLFFGLRHTAWAFADIVALLVAIGATIAAFAQVDRLAAWLLVPYLAWVGYAAALNLAIWRLNP